MSGIDAVGANNITFTGHKDDDKKVNLEKKKDKSVSFKERLTRPIKDDFKKTYKTDVKDATPEMMADYVADKTVKAITVVGGGALLLAKSRKMTNGLTSAIKENWAKLRTSADSKEAKGAFDRITGLVSGTINQVKDNNFNRLKASIQAEGGNRPGLTKSVKDAIFMPVENFEAKGLFGKAINAASNVATGVCKVFGIKGKDGAELTQGVIADKIKNGFKKVGIGNGEQLIDTTLALGATALSTGVSLDVADTATKADNKDLALAARARKALDTIDNVTKTASKFSEIADAI